VAAQLQCESARDEHRLVRLRAKQQVMAYAPSPMTQGPRVRDRSRISKIRPSVLFTGSAGVASEPTDEECPPLPWRAPAKAPTTAATVSLSMVSFPPRRPTPAPLLGSCHAHQEVQHARYGFQEVGPECHPSQAVSVRAKSCRYASDTYCRELPRVPLKPCELRLDSGRALPSPARAPPRT